MTKISLPIPT